METDHIVPTAEGGTDYIDNAIPVCFECHAEIHSYNNDHPRGRKFRPKELLAHKKQWLSICRRRPEIFTASRRDADVGPLQALIDELEYNLTAARMPVDKRGWQFKEHQYIRAIHQGAIAILEPGLKQIIHDAYVSISRANQRVSAEVNEDVNVRSLGTAKDAAISALADTLPKIDAAYTHLLTFLGHET